MGVSLISNPPYNMRWKVPQLAGFLPQYAGYTIPPDSNANMAFILSALNWIDNRAVVLLPNNVLSSSQKQEQSIRQELIRQNLLLAVITLPGDMFESTSIPTCLLIFDAFFLGIMLLCTDFHPIREHNYRKAEVVDSKFVDQEACEYCSGIYVVGYHTKCPHCGAPVKPHDFYTDADGNIINIVN